MFSFESRRLLLQLGRPLRRPRDRQILVLDPKKMFFLAEIFFPIFGHQTLDPDWIRIGSGLDPDPDRYSA
jgi:hypothetical protein